MHQKERMLLISKDDEALGLSPRLGNEVAIVSHDNTINFMKAFDFLLWGIMSLSTCMTVMSRDTNLLAGSIHDLP